MSDSRDGLVFRIFPKEDNPDGQTITLETLPKEIGIQVEVSPADETEKINLLSKKTGIKAKVLREWRNNSKCFENSVVSFEDFAGIVCGAKEVYIQMERDWKYRMKKGGEFSVRETR